MYIYPPEAYNLTHSYFFKYVNQDAVEYCAKENNEFPSCFYNYLMNIYYIPIAYIEKKDPNTTNFIIILKEKMNLQISYGSVCVKMSFLKSQQEPSIACIEIDFSKLFKTYFLTVPEKYDFGIFTRIGTNLFPIKNINEGIYDIILSQFNNSKRQTQKFYPIEDCRLFTFYHFLYYNLSLNAEQKGMEVNWNEIDIEYNNTIEKIMFKLREYETNNDSYIILDFNKTICQKKLLERGYEIVKDEFKMVIVSIFRN